jgi:hypothetical protein
MNARDGGIAALVDSCNVRRKSGLSHHVKHCVVAFLRRKHASSRELFHLRTVLHNIVALRLTDFSSRGFAQTEDLCANILNKKLIGNIGYPTLGRACQRE